LRIEQANQGFAALAEDLRGAKGSVLGPQLDQFLGVFLATALAFRNPGESEFHAYARFLLPYLRELDAKPAAERSPEEQMAYDRLTGLIFTLLRLNEPGDFSAVTDAINLAQARIAQAQRAIDGLNAEMATWDAQHARQDPGSPNLNLGTLFDGDRPDFDDRIARQQAIVREQQAILAQEQARLAEINRQRAASLGNYLLRNLSDADAGAALAGGLLLVRMVVASSS
jgi:hypothetical protein